MVRSHCVPNLPAASRRVKQDHEADEKACLEEQAGVRLLLLLTLTSSCPRRPETKVLNVIRTHF